MPNTPSYTRIVVFAAVLAMGMLSCNPKTATSAPTQETMQPVQTASQKFVQVVLKHFVF